MNESIVPLVNFLKILLSCSNIITNIKLCRSFMYAKLLEAIIYCHFRLLLATGKAQDVEMFSDDNSEFPVHWNCNEHGTT